MRKSNSKYLFYLDNFVFLAWNFSPWINMNILLTIQFKRHRSERWIFSIIFWSMKLIIQRSDIAQQIPWYSIKLTQLTGISKIQIDAMIAVQWMNKNIGRNAIIGVNVGVSPCLIYLLGVLWNMALVRIFITAQLAIDRIKSARINVRISTSITTSHSTKCTHHSCPFSPHLLP